MVSKIKKIDVLLINPGDSKAIYQELSNDFSAVEPPSLAGLFANYLRHKDISVEIVDAPAHNLSPDKVAQYVSENYDPKLIVIVVYGFQPSASTQNMPAAGETSQALKKLLPNCPIMMTGTHPAALPKRTLIEEAIDFVCDREGPETILQTLQALKTDNPDFTNVPSLWYYDENKNVKSNAPGTLMKNLDEEMPGVAWDLLPMDKYRAHNWHCFDHIFDRKPYVSMHTTLGCPYKCTFYCAMAYPGSKLYDMAIENNWELPESWIGYSQHSYETLPLRTEALTSAEVLKFRDEAFMKYFTNPKYLNFVGEKFGSHVVEHLSNMTKIKLKRKILGD